MKDSIFVEYANHPGYPFDDWSTEITSFQALVSFWTKVFEADVAGAQSDFVPMQEIKPDENGTVFAAVSRDGKRGLRIQHVTRHLAPCHGGFFVSSRFAPDCTPICDGFTLVLGTDFDEARIEVVRSVIRHQFHGQPRSLDIRNDELDAVIEEYPDLFPSMLPTTKKNLEKWLLRESDE